MLFDGVIRELKDVRYTSVV